MRIVDSGGRVYWNLYPASGTLPMLAPSALYDVTLTAQGLAGVLVQPDSYYVGPRENLALDVTVRNYDPGKRQAIVVGMDLKSDQTTIPVCKDMAFDLGPGETRMIVEKISKRPQPGNYRAVAQFRIGHETCSSRSDVIFVTNQAVPLPAAGQLFAPGTIAWGADFVRFPNLPAYAHLREMGANCVNLFVSWSQVEIRPGQYDFSMLDKMVAYAASLYTDRAFLGEAPRLDPEKMPVLVDYGLPVLTSHAADAVADYVRRGGTAVLFSQSGRFTAGNPHEQYRLLRALGYAGAAGVGPRPGEGVAAGEGILKNYRFRMRRIVPLAGIPVNHGILARLDDGQPAIARWSAGKGQVILLAGFPDWNDPATVQPLRVLLADCGVVPPASATAGVESAVLQKGDVRYVILHNPRGATVNTLVSLPDQTRTVHLADLGNRVNLCVRTAVQWRDGMTLTMSPYEIRVLALDPPDKPRVFPALDY
jgi:hypothetical protein